MEECLRPRRLFRPNREITEPRVSGGRSVQNHNIFFAVVPAWEKVMKLFTYLPT